MLFCIDDCNNGLIYIYYIDILVLLIYYYYIIYIPCSHDLSHDAYLLQHFVTDSYTFNIVVIYQIYIISHTKVADGLRYFYPFYIM